ncbi:Aste57867_8637 [Aphanomyces stellatus]|uniref:Aste57867_8637 protein n=1 Tax=Aphanomyces stellatus TaxID=120398 RepID=A0A485KKS1_9STRA|nr:hypothetical protein As57867_008603 [Aphanomyces stellatus]VFT85523.1 Aste57867_8637 [Aphanomyces stellatus]
MPSVVRGDGGKSPSEEEEKTLQRRAYYRHKRRAYRFEEANERARLQDEVQTLVAHLEKVREEEGRRREASRRPSGGSKTILSWENIAEALSDDRELSKAQNKVLLTQVKTYHVLARELRSWVVSHYALQSELGAQSQTWRDWSLPANAASRKLGKEWITNRMFHNTDRVFIDNNFPSIESGTTIEYDLEVDPASDEITIFHFRSQIYLDMDMDEYLDKFYSTLFSLRCYVPQYSPDLPLVVAEIEENTREYGFITPRDEYVHVLFGEFRTAERCVLVMTQIQDDDALRGPYATCRQRRRLTWHDIRQLPDGRLHRRAYALQTTSFTAQAPAPWDDDAADYNVDLSSCPSHLKGLQFFHIHRCMVEQRLRSGGALLLK